MKTFYKRLRLVRKLIVIEAELRTSFVPSISVRPKKTSNKSKLKQTKQIKSKKFSSTKPIKAKVTTTFRTRSNL